MNVEIGAEAALFPEKKYINGIDVVVHPKKTADKLGSAGEQINAGKFSYRPILKGIGQMLWYLYVN